MAAHKVTDDDRKTYLVMVRFPLGMKAVVEAARETSGDGTNSEFIRKAVDERVERMAGIKLKANQQTVTGAQPATPKQLNVIRDLQKLMDSQVRAKVEAPEAFNQDPPRAPSEEEIPF